MKVMLQKFTKLRKGIGQTSLNWTKLDLTTKNKTKDDRKGLKMIQQE